MVFFLFGNESESEVAWLCPTLFDPMDYSLPGSSVHGIFQARVLEWVAISFSRGSSWPRDWTQVFCLTVRLFTIWATREVPFFGNKSYEITWVFKLYMQRLIKICHICIYKCVHVCAAKLIYFNFYLYQLIYKDKSQGNFKISVWSLGLIGVQFSLVAQSCPTLCNPMNHSTPGLHWGGGPKICS